jgi:hypothetical protein
MTQGLGRAMACVVSLARKVVRSRADDGQGSRHQTTILIAASPEDALYASAGALRRLGARITRYDSDDGALEARWTDAPASLSVRAIPEAADITRLDVQTDKARAHALFRRLRVELARKSPR